MKIERKSEIRYNKHYFLKNILLPNLSRAKWIANSKRYDLGNDRAN